MSFIAISLALLFLFDIGFSLGFVFTARPVACGIVGVDLSVDRFIAEVLGPIIVVRTTIDILRPHGLTLALLNINPPPLFMRVLTRESTRMLAEPTRLGTIFSPW
jgi:hypothetical protein